MSSHPKALLAFLPHSQMLMPISHYFCNPPTPSRSQSMSPTCQKTNSARRKKEKFCSAASSNEAQMQQEGRAGQWLQAPRPSSSRCKQSCHTWSQSIFSEQFTQVQRPVGPPRVLITVSFPSDLLYPSFFPKYFYGSNVSTEPTATKFAEA